MQIETDPVASLGSSALPSINRAREIAGAILDILHQNSRTYEATLESKALHESWLDKLALTISAGKPVTFVLPAFPCKSPNTQTKVLGSLPDAGEKLALENLANICAQVGDACPKGAMLILASDGHVYNDLIKVSDIAALAYHGEVRAWASELGLKTLALTDLLNATGPEEARSALLNEFSPSAEEIQHLIDTDDGVLKHYCGLIKFLEEDLESQAPISRTKRHHEARRVARLCLLRSRGFAALVEKCFPEAFRLSIHPLATKNKFPIALINSADHWATPWHNTLVERRDGQKVLMKRRLAEAAGFKLINNYGRAWKFVES